MEKQALALKKEETWNFALRTQNYYQSLNSFYWGFNWLFRWHKFPGISSSCLIKGDLWNTPEQKRPGLCMQMATKIQQFYQPSSG